MTLISNLYLPVILWALHQILGTKRGDTVYAQLGPIINAAAVAAATEGPA